MKLSELKNGEKASIVKVAGYGGFRKRIIEMGFVKGKIVEAILDAPLSDPVKYNIMGYEVSLRRKEAELIEVVSEKEVEDLDSLDVKKHLSPIVEDEIRKLALKKRKNIKVALVGNPNCGKTTLFNYASGKHEHVGNYSGVTVDSAEGTFKQDDYTFQIVDLPGTYSISSYSPEEKYVKDFIINEKPDLVINVVDASNLERNLFLTTQLIDMQQHVIIALNMYDELQKKGDKFDYTTLGEMIGIPIVPVIARSGFGVIQLFRKAIKKYESTNYIDEDGVLIDSIKSDKIVDEFHHQTAIEHKHSEIKNVSDLESENNIYKTIRHIHVPLGQEIEKSIEKLSTLIEKDFDNLTDDYCTRYVAIKLLENKKDMLQTIEKIESSNKETLFEQQKEEIKRLKSILKAEPESAIVDAKYGFIAGALKETYTENKRQNKKSFTDKLDEILTGKILGYPIFIFFMYLMFQSTFTLGGYPMDWIDSGVSALSDFISAKMPEGVLKDLIIDGIIGGVGGVIIFLPNILILYLFISFMEDSGYMSRAAFIMDKLMHKLGLHGKSFIPLVMGFGCNIPSIMATRTIENKNSRMITILINPLMSCSARLPVYLLFVGTFFPKQAGLALFTIYIIGVLLAIIVAKILKFFLFKKEETPFVMELPPYRVPTLKSIGIHTWEKGSQYLRKMGGIILVGSIIIWFLGYYPRPHSENVTATEQMENSYIGKIGKTVEPVLKPLGFDWKISVALFSGVAAKEIVVSTLGVLYSVDEDDENNSNLSEKLLASTHKDGTIVYDTGTIWALMLFVLIYFPCLATIVAIKHETGEWKWAVFSVVYSILLAYFIAFITQVII